MAELLPKIGIIGLGSIGLRHKANFESLGCDVIGYDPTLGGDMEDVIANSDAVVIASPTSVHAAQIELCHQHRKPTLVEKPIVMIRLEWETVPLSYVRMVGYNLRYRSCVRKAREWMEFSRIGKPLWARFTCGQYNCKPAYLRDGVVLNWSHEIDLALYMLGKADVLVSSCDRHETIADIIIEHTNKCRTHIHLDYVTAPEQRDFIIVGDNGIIKVDIVQNSAYLLDKEGTVVNQQRGQYPFDQDYVAEAGAFIKLVQGQLPLHQCFFCTAKEAMGVADICLKTKENVK